MVTNQVIKMYVVYAEIGVKTVKRAETVQHLEALLKHQVLGFVPRSRSPNALPWTHLGISILHTLPQIFDDL